jgi:TRAP-type C4-dicarboxylate transport system substrate-binding protein
MWKKLRPYTVLLVIVLLVLSVLVGCSQSTTPGSTTSSTPPTSTSQSSTPATVYKLTFALFQPPTAALSVMNTAFAKEIETRTNGRVQITVQQGGSLLAAPAMYQGIVDDIADMGNGITSYSPGAFPFTSIAEAPSAAQSGWAGSNAQYDFIQHFMPKEWDNVHILTVCGPACDIMATGSANKAIKTLEDTKGMSIRTNHADIATALGFTVKDVPMADVQDSIRKGVLDAENGSPEPLLSWKLGDVTKYVTIYTGPLEPSILWYNAMNKQKWNSLPADIQQIITQVSQEYVGKLGLTWDDQAVAGIGYAKSVGDNVYALPDTEAARWSAVIAPVVDARKANVVSKGFTQQQVEDAATYFQSRLDYWNGQQAQKNITPLLTRVQTALK